MPEAPGKTIRVVEFSAEECPKSPTSGPPLFTWQEFHSFRNEVVSILSRYGSIGPMAKLLIRESEEQSGEVWGCGSVRRNPDFFVVADLWNHWNRWVRVEADSALIKPPLLHELMMLAVQFRAWFVYLALVRGGLTVFGDRILFEGNLFAGCSSIDEIYRRCILPQDPQYATPSI